MPVGDRTALCNAMKRIAADEKLAQKLSDNAVKIRETYALSKIADRFLKEAGIS